MRDVVESMTHKYKISWKVSNKSNKKIQFTTIAMQTTIYYIYIGLARMGRWWYRIEKSIEALHGTEQRTDVNKKNLLADPIALYVWL